MTRKRKQTGRYLVVSAIAMVITATAAQASTTWFPDFELPAPVAIPNVKPGRTVTGSLPRTKKVPAARQTDRNALKATRKELRRGSVPNPKEAQR